MNKYAVKTANIRAKYIVDKYQYGISCNNCLYNYNKYLLKDFASFCYEQPDIDISDLNKNSTITCGLNVTEVADIVSCTNTVSISDCDIVYNSCVVNNFEDNSYIIERVVDNAETLYFTLSNITVDGVTELSTDTLIEINPTNIVIEKINNNDFVMNVVNYINNLKIDNFKITPYYTTRDQLIFETDSTVSFTIATKANLDGVSLTRGVIITENGLLSVQLLVAASYTPVASLVPPESTVFQAGSVCSQYSKC